MKLYCNPGLTQAGKAVEVPAWLAHTRCPWMDAACFEIDYGYVLLQSFRRQQFRVQITRFIITAACTIYARPDAASIALQFTTIGKLRGEVAGLYQVALEPHHYSLFYMPDDSFCLHLTPGTYESVHFELDPLLIDELAGYHRETMQVIEMSIANSKSGIRLMPVQMDAAVHRLITNMRNSKEKGDELDELLINTIGTLLFRYKIAIDEPHYAPELAASGYCEMIEDVRREIMTSPHARNHTVDWFARKHNISESTLKRKFKSLLGITLPGYVAQQCMLKAGCLLKERWRTIDDVADELGYSDRSGFTRAFKRMYSKTPGEFRQMWNKV
ncbi:AraC family transcriptional regulator [uncultured Chitinophaga sp.]|uniref:helix-turn-helix domain-containing protein n=1 Tax=uncultured Chitinophaga sp. TaxID=339340 RepID=UPI0025EF0B3A|nr:AraC family transcriptional regulator [uncultured Chitinophaga sp.]